MEQEIKNRFDSLDARFDKIDDRMNTFDEFKDFVVGHMVTKEELDERIANLPTKEDFHNLVSVIDGYAKQVSETNQEIIVLGEKANRIESWVQKAAPKIGVEYNP